MSLEKKGKFWVVSTGGKVLYRKAVRPGTDIMKALLANGEPITIESHTQETFDDKFPDDTKIKAALAAIDHDNDEHWTRHGIPAMSYVEGVLGDTSITRRQVFAAQPDLERSE